MFCIHNIDDKKSRKKLVSKLHDVLKQNGTALIGDYIPTHQYAKYFEKNGTKVISSKLYLNLLHINVDGHQKKI
jgi:hypothetical protein